MPYAFHIENRAMKKTRSLLSLIRQEVQDILVADWRAPRLSFRLVIKENFLEEMTTKLLVGVNQVRNNVPGWRVFAKARQQSEVQENILKFPWHFSEVYDCHFKSEWWINEVNIPLFFLFQWENHPMPMPHLFCYLPVYLWSFAILCFHTFVFWNI